MTTARFFSLCYKVKLTHDDLEMMTIGNCLDYIEEYLDNNTSTKQENTVRKATQSDFDAF